MPLTRQKSGSGTTSRRRREEDCQAIGAYLPQVPLSRAPVNPFLRCAPPRPQSFARVLRIVRIVAQVEASKKRMYFTHATPDRMSNRIFHLIVLPGGDRSIYVDRT